MNYRRDIDGLRAVAVIPVILFHAGFSLFSGGFVGVDVFFVISGYLITSIIISDLENGSFSVVNFYERRVRRILPALFAVMAACIPLAWLWLLPSDMNEFSQSLISVAGFVSNIFFWNEANYFDTSVELKPLIHTWSLAVEEQFYVFFPLFLLLAWRLGRRWTIAILGGLIIVGLALAQWASAAAPAAAFFLLPMRGWELALGACAAFAPARAQRASRPVDEAASLFGIALILFAVFGYDETTPFPGVYALAPTLGALLIILFSTQNGFVGRALGSRIFVGVGLISYSAYLWHQPLFAFARQRSEEEPAVRVFIGLSLLALLCGYLSWRFIERPFRQKGRFSRKFVFSFAVAGSVFFVTVGAAGHFTDGFAFRLNPAQRQLSDTAQHYRSIMQNEAFDRFRCFFDRAQTSQILLKNECVHPSTRKRVILFGDSEAAHYREGALRHLAGTEFELQQWTAASCRAVDFSASEARCKEFYNLFLSHVLPDLKPGDSVIISSSWRQTYLRIGPDNLRVSLRNLFAELKATPAKIIVVGASPSFGKDPFDKLIKFHSATLAPAQYLTAKDYRPTNEIVAEETRRAGHIYFDPSGKLCRPQEPLQCAFRYDNEFMFFDAGHLSYAGSQFVFRKLWAHANTQH